MESQAAERYVSGGPGTEPEAPNLYRAFEATVERLGDDAAIRAGDGEAEVTLSWKELRARSRRIAGGLNSLGIAKGDTVAMLLANRPEFIPCDLGAVALGAVPFSIYPTSAPEQIVYVCSDAGARVAIIETGFLDAFNAARAELPDIEHVIVIDGEGGTHTLEEIEAIDPDFDPDPALDALGLDDLLTLIYTSGTTGPPKGVQLTHRNLLALVTGVNDVVPLPERGAKVVSWLPAAHIAERGAHYYMPVVKGVTVSICSDPRKIIEFLPSVKPTWFFAVPRIFEKLKAGLESMLAGLPDEQRLEAEAGFEASLARVRAQQAGEEIDAAVAAVADAAEEKLFAGLRAGLGLDEAVAVQVGAAPTPIEVLEFFHAIGIPISELWGMSETCGVATSNRPGAIKLGTVGTPLRSVEIKLAEDGEVLIRGDGIMPGYRNMPEKTAEAFEDGWLLSGDIGELDEDGYLSIVDRKKELIINAAGKNMSPASIEAKLKTASPLIGQVCAIGDRRPYNVALIVLDPDYAPVWAAKNGLEGKQLAELAAEAAVEAAIGAAVDAANERMARVEQVKKFTILPEDWAPGGDELTPTMKLKRKPIADKHGAAIEALYSG